MFQTLSDGLIVAVAIELIQFGGLEAGIKVQKENKGQGYDTQ